MVFVAAAATTAVLSLDATIVLLTPIVFATAARLPANPRPHVYACSHLANSASLLLPVSNLTNLLAFRASGVSTLSEEAIDPRRDILRATVLTCLITGVLASIQAVHRASKPTRALRDDRGKRSLNPVPPARANRPLRRRSKCSQSSWP